LTDGVDDWPCGGLSWYQVLMNGVLVLAGVTVSWAGVRRGLNWNGLVLIAVYPLSNSTSNFD
jgi:hypothetical protein